MNWQPIETAPKDGTEILAWREDCGVLLVRWIAPINFLTEREIEKAVSEGYREDGSEDEWVEQQDWFYADFVAGGRLEGFEVPTHWMPLPPPPMNQVTNSTEDGYAEFEVHCNGDYEASAFGPRERAWAEIQHYAAQYRQDGSVVIYEVTRRIVNPEADSCEVTEAKHG
jgi:hypothetical protein